MSQTHGTDNDRSESGAYETRDVKLRPLVVFIAGLTIVGIFTYLVIFVLFRLFAGQAARQDAQVAPSAVARPATAPGEERLPPEPRIQANPGADMKRLRDEEEATLTSYGWVDRAAGIARVPIDVAMRQVVEEGLPVRQAGDGAAAAATVPANAPQGATKKAGQ